MDWVEAFLLAGVSISLLSLIGLLVDVIRTWSQGDLL